MTRAERHLQERAMRACAAIARYGGEHMGMPSRKAALSAEPALATFRGFREVILCYRAPREDEEELVLALERAATVLAASGVEADVRKVAEMSDLSNRRRDAIQGGLPWRRRASRFGSGVLEELWPTLVDLAGGDARGLMVELDGVRFTVYRSDGAERTALRGHFRSRYDAVRAVREAIADGREVRVVRLP